MFAFADRLFRERITIRCTVWLGLFDVRFAFAMCSQRGYAPPLDMMTETEREFWRPDTMNSCGVCPVGGSCPRGRAWACSTVVQPAAPRRFVPVSVLAGNRRLVKPVVLQRELRRDRTSVHRQNEADRGERIIPPRRVEHSAWTARFRNRVGLGFLSIGRYNFRRRKEL